MEWNETRTFSIFHVIFSWYLPPRFWWYFLCQPDWRYLLDARLYALASYWIAMNDTSPTNIGSETFTLNIHKPTNQHTKYMQRIRNFSLVIADPGVNFRWISFIIVLSVKWIQFFWNCLVYYLFGMMQRIWNQRLFCSSSFFFCWSNQI